MKVAIFTLDGYINYGNILQRYALQQYIQQFNNISVDSIWYSKQYRLDNLSRINLKQIINYFFNKNKFRDRLKSGEYLFEFTRMERCYEFCQKFLNIRYDIPNLYELNTEYDYFIIGSDQVWNPRSPIPDKIKYLTFASPEKRISYAASFGIENIPSEVKDRIKTGLQEMHSISVREQSAANIVFELLGEFPIVSADPTFLVHVESWRQIESRPYWLDDKPYILCYFLGSIPDDIYKLANLFSCNIINLLNINTPNYYFVSPEEWLYLIDHAKLIYTDSFHGTVFSIIFERPFLVRKRCDCGQFQKMSTRIISLLELFDMQEYFIDNINNLPDKLFNIYSNHSKYIIQKLNNDAYKYFNNFL